MLASGGDRRISVPRGGNTNVYGASPFPRSTLGYAASTANDISGEAFRHLETVVAGWPAGHALDATHYARALERARHRLRAAWGPDADIDVVFAPSGTDLEFVALALAQARTGRATTNILLGQDEVGSGCALAAAGRYFAGETALCAGIEKGGAVAGLDGVTLATLPVRDADGAPVASTRLSRMIGRIAHVAAAGGGHTLTHVVHGSKTGLVLPDLAGIDALRARHGENLSFVVDACQARIDPADVRAYLDRQAIVLMTGSKFMGGPPFSGFALVPRAFRPARALASGLAGLFRRAEWPAGWPGCAHLPDTANPGLLLRIEAALFELERFVTIALADRLRVCDRFAQATGALADRLGARVVGASPAGGPPRPATLVTLDLSPLAGAPDLATAQRWCRVLAARGLRLGQPVRCVRAADGGWAGTLRISLSMPLIAALAGLRDDALVRRLADDTARIADVLEAAQRPVVA